MFDLVGTATVARGSEPSRRFRVSVEQALDSIRRGSGDDPAESNLMVAATATWSGAGRIETVLYSLLVRSPRSVQ